MPGSWPCRNPHPPLICVSRGPRRTQDATRVTSMESQGWAGLFPLWSTQPYFHLGSQNSLACLDRPDTISLPEPVNSGSYGTTSWSQLVSRSSDPAHNTVYKGRDFTAKQVQAETANFTQQVGKDEEMEAEGKPPSLTHCWFSV